MNLEQLRPIQAELDNRIVEEHGLQNEYLLPNKTVALLTELYETVNEARWFKFWSKNRKPKTKIEHLCPVCNATGQDPELDPYGCEDCEGTGKLGESIPLLEEFTDTVHFALSIANDLELPAYEYTEPENNDLNILTIGLTNMITRLPVEKNIEQVLNYLIKLGYQLGFDEQQVIDEYYRKNEINHHRQEVGY
ncbi:dUTP diphosphatase [Lentibacillus amyloliquefaciens]|uniref:dUTPase n=1 Tax=Lentibacillus amyloliquefaciens TaxID=1472767 RepID=A0A0U4FA06_9BACI|nr:dUTP diphosphatase [Lentibacillus amyloliquefaciens]ALX50454.1 hypothetical protein AOX59_18830 [Lentibacillus amyloliquefaciens]